MTDADYLQMVFIQILNSRFDRHGVFVGLLYHTNFCMWGFDHTGGVGTESVDLVTPDGQKALYRFVLGLYEKSLEQLGIMNGVVPCTEEVSDGNINRPMQYSML